MGKKLNIPAIVLPPASYSVNLLNGAFASLSGPIGFTPTQPRIIVKEIRLWVNGNSQPGQIIFYKGASGAVAAGTEVAGTQNVNNGAATILDMDDLVLDAGDFLVGATPGPTQYGTLTVTISAEIEY